jgi:hypothetical protein
MAYDKDSYTFYFYFFMKVHCNHCEIHQARKKIDLFHISACLYYKVDLSICMTSAQNMGMSSLNMHGTETYWAGLTR